MKTSRRIIAPVAAAGLVTLAVNTARADTIEWTCQSPIPLQFDTEFCWLGFTVPGPEDTAVFHEPTTERTIVFDAAIVTDRLLVTGGVTTFDLAGGSYDLLNPTIVTPSIAFGNTGPGPVFVDVIGGTLSGGTVSVAPAVASLTFLDVAGAPAVIQGELFLAAAFGDGFITVRDGASITAQQTEIATASSSIGIIDVTGAGTSWSSPSKLTVGKGGFARLDVTGGAQIDCGSLMIGQLASAIVEIDVRGAGSAINATGPLDLGFAGAATLTIADGGFVGCAGFATVGFSNAGGGCCGGPASSGHIVIDGVGSEFSLDGDMIMAAAGDGSVTASRGGMMTVTGDFGGNGPSRAIELGSSGDYPSGQAAIASGSVSVNSDVIVRLVDGFVPGVGDAFTLLSAEFGIPSPPLDLPALPVPLAWRGTNTGTALIISVPNPADVDGDGIANVNDLVAVITAWGGCANPFDCPEDIDGDGVVDVNDLVWVIVYWG